MTDTEAWEQPELTTPDPEPPAQEGEREYKDTTLWKKWSMAGGVGRFLSVSTWNYAAMVSVDIGETKEGTLTGHTKVWANMLELTTFLEAVRDGRGTTLYPTRSGLETPESFIHYGGGKTASGPVSRVLKVHHWKVKDVYDSSAFAWKCGHFEAKTTASGAFIPNMGKPLTVHSIKMSRIEMATLATVMHMAMVNHAANTSTDAWLEQISGRTK